MVALTHSSHPSRAAVHKQEARAAMHKQGASIVSGSSREPAAAKQTCSTGGFVSSCEGL